MAERYISIKNVVGSGPNGKVMLSDLDLSRNDLEQFSRVLSGYIRSGEFAFDLSLPDFFSSGPGNYNIIPYFDSFENYIDKRIPGKSSFTEVQPNIFQEDIEVIGTNLRAFNGSVSAKVDAKRIGERYLHSDTDTFKPWITVGVSPSIIENYYFSGYFWFVGPSVLTSDVVKISIIKYEKDTFESELQGEEVGYISLSKSDIDNATNRWTRFKSAPFKLEQDQLLTFKITANEENMYFFMDGLQLELVKDGNDIQPFIQSGVVITNGSNIAVNSIRANAIAAGIIGVDKIVPLFGDEINISGNLSITTEDQNVSNVIPYSQAGFEQGNIDINGNIENSIYYLRTKNFFDIFPEINYEIKKSSLLSNQECIIYFYREDLSLISSLVIDSTQFIFTTPALAFKAKVKIARNVAIGQPLPEIKMSDMPSFFIRMRDPVALAEGTAYKFNGDYAEFYNGGIKIIKKVFNQPDETVFEADTSGNLKLKGDITGSNGTFEGTMSASNITSGTINANNITITNIPYGNVNGGPPTDADNTKTTIDAGVITTGTLRVGPGDASTVNAGISGAGTQGTDIRFWAGNIYDNRSSAAFRVNQAGRMVSTSGNIGGWEIGSTTISTGNLSLNSSSGTGSLVFGSGSNAVSLSYNQFSGPVVRLNGGIQITDNKKIFLNNSAGNGGLEINGDGIANIVYPGTYLIPRVYNTSGNLTNIVVRSNFVLNGSVLEITM